jgi:outer membrane protein TolC
VIELALADEAISIQAGQLDWLSTIAGNARQLAANPDGSAVDALRLDVELAKETQVFAAAKRSRNALAQRLNLTLGRSLESPWPTLRLQSSPPPSPLATSEIARIPYANPQVKSMRATASAAHADTRIADREKQPALSVGVESGFYSGGDFRDATVGLKMTLPWFNEPSYNAKISAAQNRERSANQDIETARLEVASKVLTAATEAANAAAQARAYSGEIHDRAVQATRLIEGSWISSKSTLTDLLEANRTLLSIRLEQRRFIAMQLVALEELNLLAPPAKPD